ncbi:MAG: sulfate transporter CysZ [Pseudomonadales bacterium]|jgi:CysZ protein
MNGIDCFLEGFSLVRKPGLRQYVIMPAIINAVVLILMISGSYMQFDGWVAAATDWLPEWLSFLSGLVWLLAVFAVIFALFFIFTIVANIVASPFNALLSVKVEEHLLGTAIASSVSLWMILPRALWREFSKVMYLLPRLLGLVILSIIPVLNAIAPFLWLLFGAWMMAVQYSDYGADNNELSFSELRERLGKCRLQSILFGLPAYLLMAIPLVNLVILPVAVAGGTVFWVKNLR